MKMFHESFFFFVSFGFFFFEAVGLEKKKIAENPFTNMN